MSDRHAVCDAFDEWLLDAGAVALPADWAAHVGECPRCGAQWDAHGLLTAALAARAVPELSRGFDARLHRALAARQVTTRPLRGWRVAAMAAYMTGGAGGLYAMLPAVPMPRVDPAAPWVVLSTLVAVPLSFVLAIAVSRWLPARRTGL